MKKNSREIFRELRDDISSYVELKLELLKLSTYERSGHLIAVLSYGLIILFLAFFAILFIFLALGFFMGDVFGSIGAGFAFVAVLYLLLIGLIMTNKQKICNTVLFGISDLRQAQLLCHLGTNLRRVAIDSLTATDDDVVVLNLLDSRGQSI